MLLYPIHRHNYLSTRLSTEAFTIARNYFDLRGNIQDMDYVGTLYLDIDAQKIRSIIDSVDFLQEERLYILWPDGTCFYSNQPEAIGQVFNLEEMGQQKDVMLLQAPSSEYGVRTVVELDTHTAFAPIQNLYRIMYLVLGLSMAALAAGSVFFSRKLTGPLTEMMQQMKRVEKGERDGKKAVPVLKVHDGSIFTYIRFRHIHMQLYLITRSPAASSNSFPKSASFRAAIKPTTFPAKA